MTRLLAILHSLRGGLLRRGGLRRGKSGKGASRRAASRNRIKTSPMDLLKQFRHNLQRMAAPVFLLATGLLLGVYVFPWLESRINQPIHKVMVEGDLQYLQRREVMEAVPVFKGDRWFDVSLTDMQQIMEQLPWVYSVQVTRQWPHSLHIRIQEQKPIAHWNDKLLLNQYGQVFERQDKVINHLPVLVGMSGSERHVMDRYLEFSRLISSLHMRIVKLEQDERLSWTLTLDSDMVIRLGNTQALERIRRFVFLYHEQLKDDPREVVAVDLRYSSGAAVQWKAAS